MKKLKKDAMNMTVLGIGMGVGAQAITGAGGSAAGVSAMTSKFSTLGSLSGTGAIMRGIGGLANTLPKKKK
jgi:hypothetical protein